ncbi:MAG: bifunctional 5,10-methylenetetrahydrofolate dehydrogenase/5,10-methenyltetrahydrofolate cyclohydrolase [bacterium]
MSAQLLEGKILANSIKEKLIEKLKKIKNNYNIIPCLAVIQVGENESSRIYTNQQKKMCEKMGIEYNFYELKKEISQEELIQFIHSLNKNKKINGIIVQLPLPSHIDNYLIKESVAFYKDVEGLHPQNIGMMFLGRPEIITCTALSVFELIKSTGVKLYGKEAVIIGHSDIVGKPIGILLLNELATLTICHIATSDISVHIKRADILVVSVGKPNLVKGEWIKPESIVIDVGINRVGDKIVGDVEFEVAKEKASFITPVPGGVGPLTVMMLIKNIINTVEWQIKNFKIMQ